MLLLFQSRISLIASLNSQSSSFNILSVKINSNICFSLITFSVAIATFSVALATFSVALATFSAVLAIFSAALAYFNERSSL